MYGALEVAEALNIDHGLTNVTNRQKLIPYLINRGIKFNIPLDKPLATYTEDLVSPVIMDSEQSNVAEMWAMAFWSRYLIEMARHRYNTLSLWNLCPFPSMVQVPEYPNAALSIRPRQCV